MVRSKQAMETTARARRARFGDFEADLRSGELHKHGIRLKLQDQPFQVLVLLLERPGDLVTREELRQKLWPVETFVDFDTGLNNAVKKLRDVLGDSAEEPRYIETLPRRGYRFIARVENGAQPAPPARDLNELEPTATAEAPPFKQKPITHSALTHRATARRRTALLGLTAIAALVLLVAGLNLGGWRDRLLGRPMAGEITAIAVLPLENLTGDPEQQYFVDGMTESLTTELAKISALRVLSLYSAKVAKDSKKPLPEIARLLDVDAVLEGSVVRSGDRVRINVRVIHLSKERTLLSQDYQRDLSE
ncbi:MAG: winged helix-turn-helix domain-containing protein, partial [Acidobacteria bacterium]|nr:winged helix-turn-helix domain-containing protein [Acidobacteriota bacterium]